jgi:hypothetical protein
VVQALAPLRAPFRVFGCLGNHEFYTRTQDSLPRLLGTAGIRILRHATASIRSQGESVNLIGVDFRGCHDCPTFPPQDYLRGVEALVLPDTVNIERELSRKGGPAHPPCSQKPGLNEGSWDAAGWNDCVDDGR